MEFKLRKWKESDLDSLVKHANNINIAKWLTDAFPHPYTRKNGETYIAMVKDNEPTHVFAIDINNEAVGSIGIFPQADVHRKNAEMGYWLSEEYWGNGIITQAVNQVVDYGFKTFDINRIYARLFGTNIKSQRVLEKAGFKVEAQFTKTIFKNGEYLDEIIYAIRK